MKAANSSASKKREHTIGSGTTYNKYENQITQLIQTTKMKFIGRLSMLLTFCMLSISSHATVIMENQPYWDGFSETQYDVRIYHVSPETVKISRGKGYFRWITIDGVEVYNTFDANTWTYVDEAYINLSKWCDNAYHKLILGNEYGILEICYFTSNPYQDGIAYFDFGSTDGAYVMGYENGIETANIKETVDIKWYYGTNSWPVTSIRNTAFYGADKLKRIDIPSSVTSIGASAFANCSELKEIVLPNSISSIGGGSFARCSSLTNITLSNSLVGIYWGLFNGCSSLTSISIPKSVKSISPEAFNGCTSLKSVIFEDGDDELTLSYNYNTSPSWTFVGKGQFYDCPLESVYLGRTITDDHTSINYGYSPFYHQKNLSEVTIGDKVKRIPRYLFEGCEALNNIKLPDSLIDIGEEAFRGCNSLTSLSIPKSVTNIGSYAFSGCNNLKNIVIQDGESILKLGANSTYVTGSSSQGYGLFYHTAIENLYLGRNLSYDDREQLGYSPFAYSNTLKNVEISSKLSEISINLFRGCQALETVACKGRINRIDTSAFSNSSIKELNIEYGTPTIENSAFSNCTNLREFNISEGVGDIDNSGFYGCTALKAVRLSESINSIGESAFYGCSALESVTFPASLQEIGHDSFRNCSSLKELMIEDCEQSLSVGHNRHKGTMMGQYEFTWTAGLFEDCALESIYIGRDLDYSTRPFEKQNKINSVTLSENVTRLDEEFLYDLSYINSLTLPSSLLSIGNYGINSPELKKLNSLNPVPPEVGSYSFGNVDKENCVLYVPKGCLQAYSEAQYWKEFVNISDNLMALKAFPQHLYGNDDIDLTQYEPDGLTFTYFSSNPEVADVEGTRLTIYGAGETVIEAIPDNDDPETEIHGLSRKLKVNKTDLTIGVEDANITEGEPLPEFQLFAEGLVYGETLDDIEELPIVSVDCSTYPTEGQYTIHLEGGKSKNYRLSLEDGILTVSSRTGISEIFDESESNIIYVYDLRGVLIYEGHIENFNLNKGLYIIKSAKETKKVLVK